MSSPALKIEEQRPVIRRAVPEDKHELYDLLCQMHKEVGMQPMSPLKVVRTTKTVVEDGLCLVVTVDGAIVGSMGAEAGAAWYSDEAFLSERWTYVSPDHRNSSIAARLLKAMSQKSEELGMMLVAGVFSPIEPERKMKLFKRFLKPVGGIYIGGRENVL
jgi:N-acetylglutamate synthase-like GNAT family acetyltransferase|tara:strand:+ start:2664 stop:3143 length:480 start_codon:yes stop_codon:yes gene_type:complete